MCEVAQVVHGTPVPWDPFNIELIVQAQTEPKQSEFKCMICGQQHKTKYHGTPENWDK